MSETLVQPHVGSGVLRSGRFLWVWGVPAAIVSGVGMAGCFAPVGLHWMAWIAPVPFLVVLPRLNRDQAWVYGLVLGLAYYGLGLAWLYQLNHLIGAIFLFEFALVLGFGFRVARMVMERFGTGAMVWAVPVMFVGQEVLRSEAHGRLRFGFGAWGYSQANNLWVAQIASIGGVYLVSFLLMLVSAAIAYGLMRRTVRGWVPAVASVVSVLALGVVAQPGDYSLLPRVAVACVQGEFLGHPQYVKLVGEALADGRRPRIVVMPEHSLPGLWPEGDPVVEALAGLAREHGAYVCVAGETRWPTGTICDYDNVAWLIGPEGQVVLRQLKAVPIPLFRDGNPARAQEVVNTPHGRVGIYVCYDGTFTDVPRRLVEAGAEVLLGPVMDVQDWPEQERLQHADVAIFRAIELRRCVARAASSGISQVIDAAGRVVAVRTKAEGVGVLHGDVYANAEKTVFVRGGYVLAPGMCVGFLGIVVVLTVADIGRKVGRWVRRGCSMTEDPMGLVMYVRVS